MMMAIAAGGLIGTVLVAYALFAEHSSTRRRWACGALGTVLAVTFWVVQPQVGGGPDDGSSLADQWP